MLTSSFEAVDRLSHYRSEIRKDGLIHIATYRLGTDEFCKQRVAALLKDNLFVYKGHWAAGQSDKVSLDSLFKLT